MGPPNVPKGKSPFYPGQPVPVELFVGRQEQINRIVTRGAGQVAEGKPITMYVQGEYGIGKSSIANYAQSVAEREYSLYPIYAQLGGARDMTDVAAAVLRAAVESSSQESKRSERIRKWLADYIGKQTLFGVTVNLDKLRADAPSVSSPEGMLAFLRQTIDKLENASAGLFLVIDEINGIATDPKLPHFLKGMVDLNARSKHPVPLLLMLCGVAERRREMIESYPPVERIFEVIDIEKMNQSEMESFFELAFETVDHTIAPEALEILTQYSAGIPKIMHLIGDHAYWSDRDGKIDRVDAVNAVIAAAQDFGLKYVDEQIYKALGSRDYQSIFAKIAEMGPDTMTFTKEQVSRDLTDTEKKKLNNFLQKMKDLKVIRSDGIRGEYLFNSRMVRLYIWLRSLMEKPAAVIGGDRQG